MVHFNRRRIVRGRKLSRPLRPQAPKSSEASTEFCVEAVKADPPPNSNQRDSTVELKALNLESDPNDETEAAHPSIEAPLPPKRLEFACACGAALIATPEMYDKHTRCGMCQTVLLINLVYDAEAGSHEIVPFRVDPKSGP